MKSYFLAHFCSKFFNQMKNFEKSMFFIFHNPNLRDLRSLRDPNLRGLRNLRDPNLRNLRYPNLRGLRSLRDPIRVRRLPI